MPGAPVWYRLIVNDTANPPAVSAASHRERASAAVLATVQRYGTAAAVLYVFLFSGWGVSALTNALVIQNFIMWLPTVHMVVRLLRISPWAYLSSFALPIFASLVMLGEGILVQHALADSGPLIRLGATIGACGLVYGTVVLLLGRSKMMAILATLKRRRG